MELNSTHPYSPGRRLTFTICGRPWAASIKQIFRGDAEAQFTMSCTVLLECDADLARILKSESGSSLDCDLVVIKIFDAWYSEAIRYHYRCFAAPECLDRYQELPPLLQKFNHQLPPHLLQKGIIEELLNCDLLPSDPTYGDVIKFVMSSSPFQYDMIHAGVLTKPISEQDKEQYLQFINNALYDHECQVFKVAQSTGATSLPEFLVTAQVTASYATKSTPKVSELCAPATLMEYMPGITLRSWLATPTKHLDREGRLHLSRTAFQIGSALIEAVHTLMYHGLAPVDVRHDNISVYCPARDPQAIVRLYDAGGNMVVSNAHSCQSVCHNGLAPGQACLLASTLSYNRCSSFGAGIEDQVKEIINVRLMPYLVDSSLPLEDLRITDGFRRFDNTLDTMYWRILMLGVWYFDDPLEGIQRISDTIPDMREVADILSNAMTQYATEDWIASYRYWGFVALARLCHGFSRENYKEEVRRLANTLFQYLHHLEKTGVVSDVQYTQLPFTLFRTCKPIQFRNQGTIRQARSNTSVAAAVTIDVERIRSMVDEQHMSFPARFFSSPPTESASDTSASEVC